jgi:hypothetical protein
MYLSDQLLPVRRNRKRRLRQGASFASWAVPLSIYNTTQSIYIITANITDFRRLAGLETAMCLSTVEPQSTRCVCGMFLNVSPLDGLDFS